MAHRYAVFDSVAGDRTFTGQLAAAMNNSLVRNGVIKNKSDSLEVIPMSPENQGVRIRTGDLWIEGVWDEIYDWETINFDKNTDASGNDRHVLVIARLDRPRRLIEYVPLYGAPALSPQDPVVTKDLNIGIWEIPLARIRQRWNADQVLQSDITADLRPSAGTLQHGWQHAPSGPDPVDVDVNKPKCHIFRPGAWFVPRGDVYQISFGQMLQGSWSSLKRGDDGLQADRSGWWHVETEIRYSITEISDYQVRIWDPQGGYPIDPALGHSNTLARDSSYGNPNYGDASTSLIATWEGYLSEGRYLHFQTFHAAPVKQKLIWARASMRYLGRT